MLKQIYRTAITLIAILCSCAHARTYVSGGIEYLMDSREALYIANCGLEVGGKLGMQHFVEFDAMFVRKNTLFSDGYFKLKEELFPTLLNYKFKIENRNRIFWTVGVGAGLARVVQKLQFAGEDVLNEKDTVACSQVFTGVGYRLNKSVCVKVDLRYINVAKAIFRKYEDKDWNDTSVGLITCYKF